MDNPLVAAGVDQAAARSPGVVDHMAEEAVHIVVDRIADYIAEVVGHTAGLVARIAAVEHHNAEAAVDGLAADKVVALDQYNPREPPVRILLSACR